MSTASLGAIPPCCGRWHVRRLPGAVCGVRTAATRLGAWGVGRVPAVHGPILVAVPPGPCSCGEIADAGLVLSPRSRADITLKPLLQETTPAPSGEHPAWSACGQGWKVEVALNLSCKSCLCWWGWWQLRRQRYF